MPPNTNSPPASISSLTQLQHRLQDLKFQKRPQLLTLLAQNRHQRNINHITDHVTLATELELLDYRISQLEALLSRASLSALSTELPHANQVDLGSTVILQSISTQHQRTVHLVPDWEINPAQGKISLSSPLGQSLLGKQVNHLIQVSTPSGQIQYQIIQISQTFP